MELDDDSYPLDAFALTRGSTMKKSPKTDLKAFRSASISLALKIIQSLEKHQKLDLETPYDRTIACCSLQKALISVAACFMDEEEFEKVITPMMEDFKLTKRVISERAKD